MPPNHPLPFRLKVPGEDTLSPRGPRSVSYRVEGLLHTDHDVLRFEWAGTRRTQQVTLTGWTDEVDRSPIATVEVPRQLITRAELRGGWWAPRLRLWAARLDAFDGIPGARAGTVTIRIQRRDRSLAQAVADALGS